MDLGSRYIKIDDTNHQLHDLPRPTLHPSSPKTWSHRSVPIQRQHDVSADYSARLSRPTSHLIFVNLSSLVLQSLPVHTTLSHSSFIYTHIWSFLFGAHSASFDPSFNMGQATQELLIPFLGALQASIAVLLTIFVGVIASQFQLIGASASKEISKVAVRLFLPALLIVNVGSQLHADTVSVLGVDCYQLPCRLSWTT